jgi:uncharacterized membrane protein YphA (DoxX/SURF4 family)
MTPGSQEEEVSRPPYNSQATLFGVPIGEFGWFASLLIGAASGFVAFFLATFVGIFGILIYNAVSHQNVDLALSYRYGGLTFGGLVLVLAWGYLGTLWVRRITRKS